MKSDRFIKSRLRSIGIALDGIRQVLKTQQNARIHLAAALVVFITAGLLSFSILEWVFLLLVVGFVWVAEIFNTAIEDIVDLFGPGENPTAKRIKDISAGAVMVSVLVAVVAGILLFGPKLWTWILG